ncbi:hypothetical protein Patl1_24802 [Pistacia atlantica]|uniref:Uncharacterized protein n=1 Tax=Pistacia atlantica TaxID=434234 RepID=A0ACC1B0M1_9ROSI|nr:hypothetical protein Patl1_24802 [Pistacia atlantica]
MKSYKLGFPLIRLKNWSGGLLIIALAIVLFFSYSFIGIGTQPQKQDENQNQKQKQKQSADDFFRYHPGNESDTRREVKKAPPVVPRKPYIVNVEGLGDLYAKNNISEEEAKPLLTWARMRLLLSRSDALSETAQGIKEAAVAWKDLLLTIEKEKASKFNGSGDEVKNCAFSVSKLDEKLSRNGTVLELPCGLVEDSSITVVGIPDGRYRSFQIELIGSQLSGESKPPVILHYNVSLPGDNMTEEPFIIQNTWTTELGWGKEERCPAHGSADTLKVDELVLCNEQVMRSTLEENQNVSHPSGTILTNVSHGGVHSTANFPFIEGNPFTATLWVGWDGFHMTVNGRHETSFAYREVRNLNHGQSVELKCQAVWNYYLLLLKACPVSEDHDLVVDVEHLKAPSVSRKRLAVRSGDVAIRFFIGLHKNKQVNVELWREAQAYGDIQLMPFVDYYSLISLKTIAICIMGTKILPAKYVMKTDDDAFVRIDEILSTLKEKASDGLLYGLISFESSPHREKDGKWYISKEEWPHASYPPWAHGPGYIISRDVAKFIVRGHHERDLKLFKLEDVAMGIWIEQFKNSGQEVHYLSDDRFYNAGCESNYFLAHYQSPRMLLCLWEKLQKERKALCCE